VIPQIGAVGVVVPAHDEEDLLPTALRSLATATERTRMRGLVVDVVVVADACADGTAAIARTAGVRVVETAVRSVGAARAAGCREVLGRLGPRHLDTVWLATTDADSVVPRDWLDVQIRHADAGADLVLGTVEVRDWGEHPAAVADRWHATYHRRDGHPHVHGANVGARASAYLDVGGSGQHERGEDVAFAAALSHRTVVRTAANPVVTSARRRARAPGGFAEYLVGLA
jgi:glycosyltransferase involved in cell wall biosynthesis